MTWQFIVALLIFLFVVVFVFVVALCQSAAVDSEEYQASRRCICRPFAWHPECPVHPPTRR